MRGTVLGYDANDGSGVIAGEDGRRYHFTSPDWRGGERPPMQGLTVDFAQAGGETANAVYPLAAAPAAPTYPGQVPPAAAYPGQAYPGQAFPGQAYPKSHVAAGLLALFLGGFGVHKFYLGYTGPGLVLLLGTIISWVLTILVIGIFGLMAIGVVSLIEAIIYLTKSDAEFDAIYVQGRRPWF